MVDNVNEVGAAGRAANDSRHQEVAIDEPVRVEPGAEKNGEAAENVAEVRSEIFSDNGGGEVIEQLVRAQVHARPQFGAEVAYYRQPERRIHRAASWRVSRRRSKKSRCCRATTGQA